MPRTDLTSSRPARRRRTVTVDGIELRVSVTSGTSAGPPLLICNGIGANLELLDNFTERLSGIETIVFDAPGIGGSGPPRRPYRMRGLARLAVALLAELGYDGPVDVLGLSWGGALAQQLALQYPNVCRRLILAATSPGAVMVPGKVSTLLQLINPRRYRDTDHLLRIGSDLYGGTFRRSPELLARHARHIMPPQGVGYLYQLLAVWGWTSAVWLRTLRQPTLVMAGNDDPIVPLVNAKLMAAWIRDARLSVIDDGHLFLVTRPVESAAIIRRFLRDGDAEA